MEATWLLNVGELIPRKNQKTLIHAVAKSEGLHLTIAGKGRLYEELLSLIVELDICDRVKLLGYRTDISELCKSCDIFAFSSFHEGLPVSVMEAMASSLPVLCSRVRGNVDLINENGGELFEPSSVSECVSSLQNLQKKELVALGNENCKKIETFSVINVIKCMKKLYGLPN